MVAEATHPHDMAKEVICVRAGTTSLALVVVVGVLVALSIAYARSDAQAQTAAGRYAGTKVCASCHADVAARWERTLHSMMVRPATRENIHGDLSLPNAPNLREFDFAYVIGGWYKEERYVIRQGGELIMSPHELDYVPNRYVIRRTSTGALDMPDWRAACIGCHTTGYNPQTRAWSELNIGCEACHGPGVTHASAPSKKNIIIDKSAEACGSCHIRGTDNATGFGFPTQYRLGQPRTLLAAFTPIPMTDRASVFPDQRTSNRHRQQFIDFQKSKHYIAGVTCVSCHDPHTGPLAARAQLRKSLGAVCNDCHKQQVARFAQHTGHQRWQVTCAGCHTPRVIADGTISTHTFWTLTPADSLKYGEAIMANSCTKCHTDKNAAWAQRYFTEKGIGK